jgi:ligand-binding SRPBCC domain-containing protein
MGTCERMMRVDAPADVVWAWMSVPRNLFSVNMLHAEVETDETELRPGAVVTIDHDFFGFYQQRRHAKIREVRPHFVAFGEYKAPEVPGRDPFPHNQSFQVVPLDDSSSILVNRISGRYVFPGAGLLGERLFRRYMPALLDDDNQVVAVGCGAMPPTKVRRPPGLLLWPLMAFGARFVKKSTRRRLLEQMAADRAATAPTASTTSPDGATDAAPLAATGRASSGADGAAVDA